MRLPWRPLAPGVGLGPPIDTSLTEAETDELRRLAKGARVLEVGTAYGYAAIAMALGGATEVVTIDPHQALGSLAPARDHVAAWRVADRVRLLVGVAGEVLPRFRPGSFDLAFVDGDHQASSVRLDARLARQAVRPGGWLAFHDYREDDCPGVAQVLDELWPLGPRLLVDTLFVVPR
jgi:predicted O-methyltransferase YrrM